MEDFIKTNARQKKTRKYSTPPPSAAPVPPGGDKQGQPYPQVLQPKTSLQDTSLQPQQCWASTSAASTGVLETFFSLQATASRRERFLLRPKQLVRSQGLAAAKLESNDLGRAQENLTRAGFFLVLLLYYHAVHKPVSVSRTFCLPKEHPKTI